MFLFVFFFVCVCVCVIKVLDWNIVIWEFRVNTLGKGMISQNPQPIG